MPGYEIILFDLDGTLTDPAEGITNSVEYALNKMGINVKINKIYIGLSVRRSWSHLKIFMNLMMKN